MSSIISLMNRNNSMCRGADQQSANYLYRTLELLQIIAEIQLDEMDKRTARYWEEHAQEYAELITERGQLEMQVADIEKEAPARPH